MKRLALLLLSVNAAQAATYSFFSPAQTTNVIQGLIGAGTYGSAAYNSSQFAVTPYSSITIKSGAAGTNWSLSTPVISGGSQSGASYQSIKTPGLTGLLYGNDTGSVTVLPAGTTNRVLKFGTALAPTSGSIIDDGTNVNSTLPLHVNVGFSAGGGSLIKKIIVATNTIDAPLIGAQNSWDTTVTVTGADDVNGVVVLNAPVLEAGFVVNAWISATNTVTVRYLNGGLGALDPIPYIVRTVVFNY